MNLLPWRRKKLDSAERVSLDDYAQMVESFMFNGLIYNTFGQTLQGQPERVDHEFAGYVNSLYKSNGIVFACMLARRSIFTEARFQFRSVQRQGGRPGPLFGTPALRPLERPYPGGVTADMLARMIDDADLAGNWFGVQDGNEIIRLRPDWVDIALAPRIIRGKHVGYKKAGYVYYEGGIRGSIDDAAIFTINEVAHFAPNPDPLYSWRGMSWLTPVLREVSSDKQATQHKSQFFENGATPNMVVKLPEMTKEQFEKFKKQTDAIHKGVHNAYKTMYLGGGADVTVVGSDFKQIDFKATQGAGEPLALDTPVATPAGWTTMGKIKPGDQVIGRDGLPARVVGVSPVHVGRDCYRVTFNDRTNIVADAEHLWTAIDRNTNDRRELTYTTAELRDLIAEWDARGNGGNRIAIPSAEPFKSPDVDLLVDPYVLGAWLGDGQTAGAAICGAEDDLAVIAAEIDRRGYTVTRWKSAPDKVAVIGIPGGLLAALRALDVLGDKRIPAEYLRASHEQRLDLLRGLMDTDGTVGHAGRETCEFSSKLESLARQVAELARSLGYRVTVSRRVEPRSRTGETWRVTFRANPDVVPFLLPRKASRCVTPVHVRNRAIVSIEPVESTPVRCIAVDAPDHLFVAGDGWVLTHNTRIAAASGIHPVIIGLSEGLAGSSLNQGNFQAARRLTGDKTIRPLWRNAAASLEQIVPPPAGAELWYDERDVAFLRDDQKDVAEIQSKQAVALRALLDAGYNPDASVRFLQADDLSELLGQHSGLFSVQLQPPGASNDDPAVRVQVNRADEFMELIAKGWRPVQKPLELEAA